MFRETVKVYKFLKDVFRFFEKASFFYSIEKK